VGYGKTFTVDGLPLVGSWGGGNFTARAVARIGRLALRQGDWEGLSLLSREAVRRMTGDAGLPGHCGMGWWTNAAGRYAGLPKDAVWGAGAGDQLLLVIPSLNLMMVRTGRCYRTSVVYNAALRRYLLVQPLANAASRDGAGKLDVRFSGGLAIYDAPEPWGPWTTVYFTEQWDVGPGDTASFPTKWMSADGKTLHLIFSGDDYFSVRRATLTTAAK
jgi:hypothetical protein